MKRRRLLALLGAGVLTLGTVGAVYANKLSEDHPNSIGKAVDSLADEDCSDFTGANEVGEGEVGLHFILTKPEAETGNISGSVDGDDFGPVAGVFHGGEGNGGGAMHFYVVVDGDGDSVIDEAETDVDGNNLTLSHICVGDEETTTTSNSGGDQPNTDTLGGRTSTPADSAWLLVVALGVLLASLVVLSPARSKR